MQHYNEIGVWASSRLRKAEIFFKTFEVVHKSQIKAYQCRNFTSFQVVDLCHKNIISGDTAEKLELLQRMTSIDTLKFNVTQARMGSERSFFKREK